MLDLTRRYEALLLVSPESTEESLAQLEAEISDLIGKAGGQVTEKFNLGKRKLSFKIGRFNEAIYLEIRFASQPAQIAGLKKAVGLLEKVIRFMVGRESTKPAPVSIAATSETASYERKSGGRDGESQ